jgi:hypothetical protein
VHSPEWGPAGELALTYDSSQNSDGVGSQLQRIYGFWAASRHLDVKYVHTPIERVGYQGLMPLLTGTLAPDFADRLNAFFTLPSDDFDLEHCDTVVIHTLTLERVEARREQAATAGRSILLKACTPLGYTDHVPEVCARIIEVSPYRRYHPSGPLRVCVHLRRGDNSVSGRADRDERLLPNGYYLRILATLVAELERQGLPFVVRVHTEVPPEVVTLQPGTPGIYFRLDDAGTIDPAEFALEEFDVVPNLTVVANADPMEVMDDIPTRNNAQRSDQRRTGRPRSRAHPRHTSTRSHLPRGTRNQVRLIPQRFVNQVPGPVRLILRPIAEVGVQGDHRRGVAQRELHYLDVGAAEDQRRGEVVPEQVVGAGPGR